MPNVADLILMVVPAGADLSSIEEPILGVMADSSIVLVPDPPVELLRDRSQHLDVVAVDTRTDSISRHAVGACQEARNASRAVFLGLVLREPFSSGPTTGPSVVEDLERGLQAHPHDGWAALVEAGAVVGPRTVEAGAIRRYGELERMQRLAAWRVTRLEETARGPNDTGVEGRPGAGGGVITAAFGFCYLFGTCTTPDDGDGTVTP